MSVHVDTGRVERRRFFDDGDGKGLVKREDETVLWDWDWANEFINGVFMVSPDAAFCKVYDTSAAAYRDTIEGGWADFVEMAAWPSTTQDNDALYFGNLHWPDEVELSFDTPTTAAVYTGDAVTWEYWNGTAWVALTLLGDTSDLTGTGAQPFSQGGDVTFNKPVDIASVSVDGQTAEWIRARVSTVANLAAVPVFAYMEADEFVSTVAYVDSGVTRTSVRLDGNVTSALVSGVGEFECTVTSNAGRVVQKVFRFYEPSGARTSDYP